MPGTPISKNIAVGFCWYVCQCRICVSRSNRIFAHKHLRGCTTLVPQTWMEDVLRKIPYYQCDLLDRAELLPFNFNSYRVGAKSERDEYFK